MKRVPAKDRPLLAAIIMYVDKNQNPEDLYILTSFVDICLGFIEGPNCIYKIYLVHLSIFMAKDMHMFFCMALFSMHFWIQNICLIHFYNYQPRPTERRHVDRNCRLFS